MNGIISKPSYSSNVLIWFKSICVIVMIGHGLSLVEGLPSWATNLVQLGGQWDQVTNQFALNCDTAISLEQKLFPLRTLPPTDPSDPKSVNRADYVTRLSLKELELHIKRKETQYFASAVEEIFYSSILRLADDAYQLENNLNETIKALRNVSYSAKLYPGLRWLPMYGNNATEYAKAFINEYESDPNRFVPIIRDHERDHLLNLLSIDSIANLFKEKVRKNFHHEMKSAAKYSLDLFKEKWLSDALHHLSRNHVVGYQLIDLVFRPPASQVGDSSLERILNQADDDSTLAQPTADTYIVRSMSEEPIDDGFDMKVIHFAFERMFNEKLTASSPPRPSSPWSITSRPLTESDDSSASAEDLGLDLNSRIDERKMRRFIRFLRYLRLTFRAGLVGASEALKDIHKPTDQLINMINTRVAQVTLDSYNELTQLIGS